MDMESIAVSLKISVKQFIDFLNTSYHNLAKKKTKQNVNIKSEPIVIIDKDIKTLNDIDTKHNTIEDTFLHNAKNNNIKRL